MQDVSAAFSVKKNGLFPKAIFLAVACLSVPFPLRETFLAPVV
jgi:hypothetical protein